MHGDARAKTSLTVVHRELEACRKCANMTGPVVHGPPVISPVFLLGQAPGPHEGKIGRPFAWTAGKTLFRWFEESLGVAEEVLRNRMYMAAVARCFPGKATGGGDRKPNPLEVANCSPFLKREVQILQPELLIAVGTLAIETVTGARDKLVDVVGTERRVRYHDVEMDMIALPHPSGANPWHKVEPGRFLLLRALQRIKNHPAMRSALNITTEE